MRDTAKTFFDIVIIGTGFAGLGMAARLKQSGREDFVILERANDIGGTWRDNTYPGVACDVPSPLYSFSFRLNAEWSRLFSPGAEIHAYMKSVAREEGLIPHVRFNAAVKHAFWDTATACWRISTAQGEIQAKFLITGTGHLADESLPNIPGLSGFTGQVFHSARWRNEAVLEGKRIGIVGSGASAIQLVPEVAKIAGHMTVFQRSAPYIIPRPNHVFTDAEKRLFRRDRTEMRKLRESIFWMLENTFASRRGVPRYLAENKQQALLHLAQQIPDPELQAKLTPDYEIGCKRVLLSNDYYPTFLRDNVTLEDTALESINGGTVVAASGTRVELDVLIFCTGFEAATPPYATLVHGSDGRSLAEHWQSGMEANASTTVNGFPNLFIINGPNTGLGHNSIVYIIESQVEYILEALNWVEKTDHGPLEPLAAAQSHYSDSMQDSAAGTVWLSSGCKSWYLDPRSRKLTLIWPSFAHNFRHRNGHFSPDDYLDKEKA
ncbi:flavin-containing monooxygenase [Serratia sp. TSA_198.1]|jgi:cation diffusion facilitator CzcD-associated flavoprotein CzcO|uniref:flavin-containing monooxygenase n=1 Tax=Serratia sp. TSA_198.1 TaxID=3415664 RepID=UPI004046789F